MYLSDIYIYTYTDHTSVYMYLCMYIYIPRLHLYLYTIYVHIPIHHTSIYLSFFTRNVYEWNYTYTRSLWCILTMCIYAYTQSCRTFVGLYRSMQIHEWVYMYICLSVDLSVCLCVCISLCVYIGFCKHPLSVHRQLCPDIDIYSSCKHPVNKCSSCI